MKSPATKNVWENTGPMDKANFILNFFVRKIWSAEGIGLLGGLGYAPTENILNETLTNAVSSASVIGETDAQSN